jgi:hypothetical protein
VTNPESVPRNVSEKKFTTFRPLSPVFGGPGAIVTTPRISDTQSLSEEPQMESDSVPVSKNMQSSPAKYPVLEYYKPKLLILDNKTLEIPKKMSQRDFSEKTFTSKIYTQQSPALFQSKLHQRDLSKIRLTPEQRAVGETESSAAFVRDWIRQSGAGLEEEWESISPRISDTRQRKVEGNSDAVVPQRDISLEKYWRDAGVGSGRYGIGAPVTTSTPKFRGYGWEPVATSTPKPLDERLLDSNMMEGNQVIYANGLR